MSRLLHCLLLLVFLCFVSLTTASSGESQVSSTNSTKGISLAGWKFEHLRIHLTITIFIMSVIIVKMGFEYVEVISSVIPESCLLITVGVIFGAVIKFGLGVNTSESFWTLSPDLFLLILLPPIVLESAHGLSQRAFGDVFGPVLLFAAVGTILNFLLIGFSLFGLNKVGAMPGTPVLSVSFCLLFGSLIVAVDPVAVLAIFEELGVDKTLYFLVFGESLFNDAVTIVLYNMIIAFVQMDVVSAVDIVFGVASFFTVSVGGALIGLLFGVASCLLTRCTAHLRLLEPLLIMTTAYLSYLAGDLVEWSGMISMIACGVVQATYAFHNMSPKSVTVTRRALKILSKLSESVIFFFLGITVVRGDLKWDTGFILWSMALCLVVRFLVTFAMSLFLNKTKTIVKRISFTQQLIIGYGGLRGAVSFSLASMITDAAMKGTEMEKEVLVTATLFIVFFTIIPMGITIKPLVKLLKIRLEENTGLSLMGEIANNSCDHFSAGMEAIAGVKGENSFREWIDNFDTNYVRRFLQSRPESNNQGIIDVYEKVALALHYATMRQHDKTNPFLEKLSTPLKDKFLSKSSKLFDVDAIEDEVGDGAAEPMLQKEDDLGRIGAALLTMADDSCEFVPETRKRRFATHRFALLPEARPDDFAGLFKASLHRQNAMDGVSPAGTPSQSYVHRMRRQLARKNRLLNPLMAHDDPQQAPFERGLSLPEPRGPRHLQRQRQVRNDNESGQLAVHHESPLPEVLLEIPGRCPEFSLGPEVQQEHTL